MDYKDFLNQKHIIFTHTGKQISTVDVNPYLFDFQRDIVRWACSKGRAAIFANTGLGKTFMQLEWGRQPGIVGPAMPEPGTCCALVTRWNGWGFCSDYCGQPVVADRQCKNHLITEMEN